MALVTGLLCAAYTFYLDPEVGFLKGAIKVKQAWATKMTREHGAKIVVYGGSSCLFSINGERMLEKHGIPTVNMGLVVTVGPAALTGCALSEVRPGDTLIVALEPDLLTKPFDQTALACKISLALHSPEWLARPWLEKSSTSWINSVLALRPGAYHLFTLFGKLAVHAPLYRYSTETMNRSGWETTSVRMKINGPSMPGEKISPEARALLRWLRDWGRQNHVRVAYSFPWSYSPVEALPRFQRENAAVMEQIAEFIPVLKDPRLGAYTVREHFADTLWHLVPEAAALRTDELAREIKNWNVWTPAELRALAHAPSPESVPPKTAKHEETGKPRRGSQTPPRPPSRTPST